MIDYEVAYDELIDDYSELMDLLKMLYEAHDENGVVTIDFWDMQHLLDVAHRVLEMGGAHKDQRDDDDSGLDV